MSNWFSDYTSNVHHNFIKIEHCIEISILILESSANDKPKTVNIQYIVWIIRNERIDILYSNKIKTIINVHILNKNIFIFTKYEMKTRLSANEVWILEIPRQLRQRYSLSVQKHFGENGISSSAISVRALCRPARSGYRAFEGPSINYSPIHTLHTPNRPNCQYGKRLFSFYIICGYPDISREKDRRVPRETGVSSDH